ncbi:helix-turn-helix domain-containing protein [Streptomyces sp. N2-109]|uniref:Helix-turn-helix domain-containing protein n=1 Tax=Streptomyces gossypii TaxID=2883101 RepID=A0ABT2JY13_9ACTN|nr:helix-turn-helix domain-containing protein [Streptomyces gossypii]MCT2592225.1 helix-turn-helix domain-containing protein [Streptomyces gossypii]
MGEPQPSATPRAGVTHVRTRHADRFTVVGNHLAQHRELTLVAIGLAVHIQSLPDGARVDIKTLTARFPEGEVRIAAALRELEAHDYLTRTRARLPSGRIVTHTVSYDQPGAPPVPACPQPEPEPKRREHAAPAPAPLPEPRTADLPRHRTAADLLAALRRDEPRLLLPERDVRRLAPATATWLERGIDPAAVRRTLTANLPQGPLRHPAALLAHRLTALMPPPLPAAPPPAPRPHPLQNCDHCDRAHRSPTPGPCPTCRPQTAPLPLAA